MQRVPSSMVQPPPVAPEPWLQVEPVLCRLCSRSPTESLTPVTHHCLSCGCDFVSTIYRTGGGYSDYEPCRCVQCARKAAMCQSCGKLLDPKDKAALKPKAAVRVPIE